MRFMEHGNKGNQIYCTRIRLDICTGGKVELISNTLSNASDNSNMKFLFVRITFSFLLANSNTNDCLDQIPYALS